MHLITHIEKLPLPQMLTGFSLDLPKEGEQQGLVCPIAGWVLGDTIEVDSVEVTTSGVVLRKLSANLPRPDVQAFFAGNPRALHTGFHGMLSLHFLPSEGTLKLAVCPKGQTEHSIDVALVKYRHAFRQLASGGDEVLQPLVISAIGRSGTTWLMHLLSQHPEIATYATYPYEFHVGSYFQQLLRVLMSPADYTYSSTPTGFWFEHTHIGHPPFQAAPPMDFAELDAWLSSSLWPLTSEYVVRATDRFYRSIAQRQGKRSPKLFAEKQTVPWFGWLLRALYPAPKEIFLVRDFRDVFCSILAFNRKRGIESFGRERVASDAAYAEWLNVEITYLVENWLARASDSLLVRYEDLIRRPMQVLDQIFTYLGVNCSQAVVEGVLSTAQQQAALLEGHVTAQDSEHSIGRWRSDLSPDLAQVVNDTFAANLLAVGYMP